MSVITLDPAGLVARIVADDAWSVVVERQRRYVRLVAVRPTGEPTAFVRVHKKHVGALIEALIAASDDER